MNDKMFTFEGNVFERQRGRRQLAWNNVQTRLK